MKRMFAVLSVLAAVVGATATPTLAGVRTIWIDQCTPVSGQSIADSLAMNYQNSVFIANAPGTIGRFECRFSLPRGTKVTRLEVNVEAPSGWLSGTLFRMRHAADPEYVVEHLSVWNQPRGWYATSDVVEQYARVGAGYRYYLNVQLSDARLFGARVYYR